jgi:hypothetical protein
MYAIALNPFYAPFVLREMQKIEKRRDGSVLHMDPNKGKTEE